MAIRKIEITLSLLQSSVYQALEISKGSKGVIAIEEESERLIISKFLKSIVNNHLNRSEYATKKHLMAKK